MKRQLIQEALKMKYQSLSREELKSQLDIDVIDDQPHLHQLLIFWQSQDDAEDMSEEEMDAFWKTLPL